MFEPLEAVSNREKKRDHKKNCSDYADVKQHFKVRALGSQRLSENGKHSAEKYRATKRLETVSEPRASHKKDSINSPDVGSPRKRFIAPENLKNLRFQRNRQHTKTCGRYYIKHRHRR